LNDNLVGFEAIDKHAHPQDGGSHGAEQKQRVIAPFPGDKKGKCNKHQEFRVHSIDPVPVTVIHIDINQDYRLFCALLDALF
jgi:hypothetical protein